MVGRIISVHGSRWTRKRGIASFQFLQRFAPQLAPVGYPPLRTFAVKQDKVETFPA